MMSRIDRFLVAGKLDLHDDRINAED